MKTLQTTLTVLALAGSVVFSEIQAEEAATPLLTALSSTTISGYVDVAAHWNPGTGTGSIIAVTPWGVSEIKISPFEAELLYFAALAGQQDFIDSFFLIKALNPEAEFTPENINPAWFFTGVPSRTLRLPPDENPVSPERLVVAHPAPPLPPSPRTSVSFNGSLTGSSSSLVRVEIPFISPRITPDETETSNSSVENYWNGSVTIINHDDRVGQWLERKQN